MDMCIQMNSTLINIKKLQRECLIGSLRLSLSGLPGEGGNGLTVCAEFYHLGLPTGLSGGGVKDFITCSDFFICIHSIQTTP